MGNSQSDCLLIVSTICVGSQIDMYIGMCYNVGSTLSFSASFISVSLSGQSNRFCRFWSPIKGGVEPSERFLYSEF